MFLNKGKKAIFDLVRRAFANEMVGYKFVNQTHSPKSQCCLLGHCEFKRNGHVVTVGKEEKPFSEILIELEVKNLTFVSFRILLPCLGVHVVQRLDFVELQVRLDREGEDEGNGVHREEGGDVFLEIGCAYKQSKFKSDAFLKMWHLISSQSRLFPNRSSRLCPIPMDKMRNVSIPERTYKENSDYTWVA
ncbi:hypothetical protein L596_020345 [Steinernema carpocapsae]|uniref:Uncharacterized protein n=1 Tax=Steinernema carpocapsae TaxID=34508 RepID=A0A4U5MT89_STECR|nr:hypothetical protein L596_020345 [Steinernema carpocapsae]